MFMNPTKSFQPATRTSVRMPISSLRWQSEKSMAHAGQAYGFVEAVPRVGGVAFSSIKLVDLRKNQAANK